MLERKQEMYKSYFELGAQTETNRDQYSVLELKSVEEKKELIGSNRIVCVDVYADWCGPCKQTEPQYSMIAQNYNRPGICAVVKENWNLKLTDGVEGLPTYFFYLDGKELRNEMVIGADVEQVEQKISALLQNIQNNSSGPLYSNTSEDINLGGPQYNRNSIRNYRGPSGTAEWQQNNNMNMRRQ